VTGSAGAQQEHGAVPLRGRAAALVAAAPVLLLGRRRVDRFLAGWFLVMLIVLALQGALSVEALGTDANLYRFAASAYLAGDDPWNRAGGDWAVFQFAGLPPTILAFVPFAFLPEPIVMTLWVALSLAAAILIVRALRLPVYWLLFPRSSPRCGAATRTSWSWRSSSAEPRSWRRSSRSMAPSR